MLHQMVVQGQSEPGSERLHAPPQRPGSPVDSGCTATSDAKPRSGEKSLLGTLLVASEYLISNKARAKANSAVTDLGSGDGPNTLLMRPTRGHSGAMDDPYLRTQAPLGIDFATGSSINGIQLSGLNQLPGVILSRSWRWLASECSTWNIRRAGIRADRTGRSRSKPPIIGGIASSRSGASSPIKPAFCPFRGVPFAGLRKATQNRGAHVGVPGSI
jgi:hypothetical protein